MVMLCLNKEEEELTKIKTLTELHKRGNNKKETKMNSLQFNDPKS